MKRFIVTLAALAVSAFALVGCTVEAGPSLSGTYEFCVDSDDCASVADECLTIDLGDGRRDNHCSRGCLDDSGCPSFNGIPSACYELFGDPGRNTTCFERCDSDLDCSWGSGFVCTTATMGGVPTDAICVPG